MNKPAAPHVLVIDLGTTSLRCSVVDESGTIRAWRQSTVTEIRDAGGLAWDGAAVAERVLEDVRPLARDWSPAGIAIANQRTTALIWEATTGQPLGPVLSWSDGRTSDLDRALRRQGIEMIPGLSASKWCWLLDRADPTGVRRRAGDIRVGTLETWLAWVLSDGSAHVSDHVNASHSGLFDLAQCDWDRPLAEALGLAPALLPDLVPCRPEGIRARAIDGAPPILALIGDQQASLHGQGASRPGRAKITFGTSAVLNTVLTGGPLANPSRAAFGNVALSTPEEMLFGAEAAVMSAGSSVEWLIRLGILPAAAEIDNLVDPTVRGDEIFVAALDGLGVPHWQARARGTFHGLSGASGPGAMVRAVLDGIAAASADIVEHAEAATGQRLEAIGIDGGLTKSAAFRAILSATLDRSLIPAPDAEATTKGAAMLALAALGSEPPGVPETPPLQPPAGTLGADCAAWADAVTHVIEHAKNRKTRIGKDIP